MPKAKTLPTLGDLRARFRYDAETGIFYHAVGYTNGIRAGDVAGCKGKGKRGYVQLQIDGRLVLAHRVAWFLITGIDDPTRQVDHKNCNKSDNRFVNLRLASPSQNGFNASKRARNKSGFKGVRWDKGKWEAVIKANRKKIYLGRFDDPREAHCAYVEASKRYHGEFARSE